MKDSGDFRKTARGLFGGYSAAFQLMDDLQTFRPVVAVEVPEMRDHPVQTVPDGRIGEFENFSDLLQGTGGKENKKELALLAEDAGV